MRKIWFRTAEQPQHKVALLCSIRFHRRDLDDSGLVFAMKHVGVSRRFTKVVKMKSGAFDPINEATNGDGFAAETVLRIKI